MEAQPPTLPENLTIESRAFCWGRNHFGELGHNGRETVADERGDVIEGMIGDVFVGNPRASKTTPTQVYGLTSRVTQISVGGFHTCALVNGGAQCWGSSFFGQLGNGQIAGNARSDALAPQQVTGLTSGVTQISAGRKHTCAVAEGRALCWGQGASGQLGYNGDLPASTPQQVIGLTSGVTQISAGDSHTCAVMNGAAWCWGEGAFAQVENNARPDALIPQRLTSSSQTVILGSRVTTKPHTLIPKQVRGLTSGVTQISAGGKHTCALVEGGRAVCWGEGDDGRLGHNWMSNPEADRSVPTPVSGLTSGVTQISAGGRHTCALVNGSIQCWGKEDNGRLGRRTSSPAPTPVSGL